MAFCPEQWFRRKTAPGEKANTEMTQMTWRYAMFFGARRGDNPFSPAAPSCVQARRAAIRHRRGRSEIFIMVCLSFKMPRCLLAHFQYLKIISFCCKPWTKKFVHETFLINGSWAMLTQVSCIYSFFFDTGLNTCYWLEYFLLGRYSS